MIVSLSIVRNNTIEKRFYTFASLKRSNIFFIFQCNETVRCEVSI